MSERRRQRFVLGLFVLTGLITVAVLIFLFGSAPRLFTTRNAYTVLFDDAPGINPGTPVRRSGVRVGEVGAVELDPESGKVRVELLLQPSYTPRANEEPTIAQGLLSGDTSIDFVPREQPAGVPPDRTPVPPDVVLIGRTPPGAQKLIDPAQQSLDQIRRSLERLEKLEPKIEEALDEVTALARAGREFVPELRRTNDALREGVQGTRGLMAELRRTNETARSAFTTFNDLGTQLNTFVRDNQAQASKAIENISRTAEQASQVFSEQNRKNIDAALQNIRRGTDNLEGISKRTEEVLTNLNTASKPLAERSERILRNLESVTENLAHVLGDGRELMRALSDSDGTVARLLNDPSLYNNLNEAVCVIAKTAPRLDRILKDVEVFADKIARHPELLGAGGAIRPSGGLKDSAPPPAPGAGLMHRPR
jgi:phospholipid/cholesterol/gamma-HCH transport system substrate-binding protein